jgi:ABC-type hemin transport system ATPase subunit
MVALTGGNWGRTDGGVIPVLPSAMVLLAHVFDLRTRQLQKLSGKQQKVSPVRVLSQRSEPTTLFS